MVANSGMLNTNLLWLFVLRCEALLGIRVLLTVIDIYFLEGIRLFRSGVVAMEPYSWSRIRLILGWSGGMFRRYLRPISHKRGKIIDVYYYNAML